MPRFSTGQFFGIAPKINPRSLAEGMAQVARNCRLGAGHLAVINQPAVIQTLPLSGATPVQTLYQFDDAHWFTFFSDVDVVRGPLPEDPTHRTYFTDDNYPKVTRNDIAISASGVMPAASYRLGVPAPTNAPFGLIPSGQGDTDNEYDTAYVYTYVTAWGEEGPPSPPSSIVTVAPGQSVSMNLTVPPSGNYNWNLIRIYRLNTGSAGTEYQFVGETPSINNTFSDSVPNDSLGELLPTTTWYPPPDENYGTGTLRGMVALPNGSLAGFSGQSVCISLPYLPHAWPFESRFPIKAKIVGLAPSAEGLVVLTDEHPYIAAGTDPQAMVPQRLNGETQACVSKRSIVDMGGAVIYASPDGLIGISGGQVSNLTQMLFTPRYWRENFQPETLHGYSYEGCYVGFYKDAGNIGRGFILDPGAERAAFIELDLYADAGYTDADTDSLYLNIDNELVRFDADGTEAMTATWRSKVFVTPFPISLAVLRVVAAADCTVRVYADGNLLFDDLLSNYETVRLPSGDRYKEWEYEIETRADVTQIDLASSVRELQP